MPAYSSIPYATLFVPSVMTLPIEDPSLLPAFPLLDMDFTVNGLAATCSPQLLVGVPAESVMHVEAARQSGRHTCSAFNQT